MHKRVAGIYNISFSFCVTVLSCFLLLACSETNETAVNTAKGTGSYTCSLRFPNQESEDRSPSAMSRALDCTAEGIQDIVFTFYNQDENVINDPTVNTYACSLHRATIDGLPIGSGYRLVITGVNPFGVVVHEGGDNNIEIIANVATDGGEIPMLEICTDEDLDNHFLQEICPGEIDCDDGDENRYPGLTENCSDTKDNDCDGSVDCADTDCSDDASCQGCTDADNDDYSPQSDCGTAIDCDDSDETINPGAPEICDDSKDNDCDGNTDCDDSDCVCTSWYRDADGDLFGSSAVSLEAVSQPTGYVSNSTDCDDSDETINPDGVEICEDTIDQDCNGSDLVCPTTTTWYHDNDNDTYGDPNDPMQAATQPAGYVDNNTDCNDNLDTIHPGATENCSDTVDNDCDGDIDGNDTECGSQTLPDMVWGDNWGEANWQ